MTEQEQLQLMVDAAKAEIEVAHESMRRHLDESERIHARDASQTIVNIAKVLATDPTI